MSTNKFNHAIYSHLNSANEFSRHFKTKLSLPIREGIIKFRGHHLVPVIFSQPKRQVEVPDLSCMGCFRIVAVEMTRKGELVILNYRLEDLTREEKENRSFGFFLEVIKVDEDLTMKVSKKLSSKLWLEQNYYESVVANLY